MYAALAGGLLGLAAVWAAWDFGRRWLVMRERAEEAALIRASEVYDDISRLQTVIGRVESDALDRHGDLQSTLNLRVRELGDRIDDLCIRATELERCARDHGELMKRLDERADENDTCIGELQEAVSNAEQRINEAFGRLAALEQRHDVRLCALEQRPAESPDLSKHDAAVKNLAAQLQELSAHMTEELKKVRTAQAGTVAVGSRRFPG